MSGMELLGLQGRVAVVTGAGRGMGRAIATLFSQAGASTVAADYVFESVRELAAELEERGGTVLPLQVDVSSDEQVASMAAAISARFGRVNILVNNAGVLSHNNITDCDPVEWNRITEVNLGGTIRCCRALVPLIKRAGGGRIINQGSSFSGAGSVLNRRGGGADYCLAKASVQAFTRLLAFELAPFQITVNAMAPGIVDTPMHTRGSEAMQSKYAPLIPLGRLAQPEDIAHLALFLASDMSAYITGQTIHINGGMLMEG